MDIRYIAIDSEGRKTERVTDCDLTYREDGLVTVQCGYFNYNLSIPEGGSIVLGVAE